MLQANPLEIELFLLISVATVNDMLPPSFFLLLLIFSLQHVKLSKQTTNSVTWNFTSNIVTFLRLRITSFAVIASIARAWTCSLAAITSFWACAPGSPRSPNTWGWKQREKKKKLLYEWNYVQGVIAFFGSVRITSELLRKNVETSLSIYSLQRVVNLKNGRHLFYLFVL